MTTTPPTSPLSSNLAPPEPDLITPPLPHHAMHGRRGRWVGLPTKGDPRLPFAALMTTYAVVGMFVFTFNRSPLQMLVIVASAALLEMFLHYTLRKRELLFPMSAYISSVSLVLILGYADTVWITLFPVYLTIGLKYVLTLRGRHAFNPSLLGVVGSLLFAGTLISAAPAYQWGGWWYTSTFMVAAAVLMFVMKVNRGWLVGSFLVFYVLQTALRAYFMRHHLPWEVMFLGTLTTPPFFLFAFFMITDPATSPSTRKGQIWLAFAITVVDLYFHTRWSVFTFFYAAMTVASARFVIGHLKVLREMGLRARFDEVRRSRWPRSVLVVAAIGVLGGGVWTTVVHPAVRVTDAGFTLTKIAPADSGVRIAMDPGTLKQVDPRLQHIAKWLLSVGSGAFVDDVDGDGRMDLFVTSPLAEAGDRAALFHNVTEAGGKLRFERVMVPALEHFAGAPQRVGLASGGLFFDADGDGDRDLLIVAAFGEVHLLRNDTKSGSGKIDYTDVSAKAGVGEYMVGASANAIDYDQDGDLDVLLGEILPNELRGYDEPTRFNIFDLPKPQYDGDRRAMRFMHSSWDNATNGSENVMYRNEGDGTFTRIRGRDLGMPETHWTISIGTADLNEDGYTDLYLASDFGRDDLYINEGGKGFRRVQGWFHGSVGKDTYKGMNSTIEDLDRNGHQDIYISNVHQELQAEGSILWMNQGAGTKAGTSEHNPGSSAKRWPAPKLQDEATSRGALNENRFGWGADSGDFDNDGWMDLAQANGMVGDKLDEFADGKDDDGCPDYWYVNHKLMQSGPEVHTYADKWGDLRGRCIYADEEQRLYLNRGVDKRGPEFVDVAKVVGLNAPGEGRGTAIADFDNDGWLDLVVSMQHEQPVVLQGDPTSSSGSREWLSLRLVGDGKICNRDAVGSIVRVLPSGRRDTRPQMQELRLVNGFSSQRDPRLHFGLGSRSATNVGTPVDIEVTWCGRGAPDRHSVLPSSTVTITQ